MALVDTQELQERVGDRFAPLTETARFLLYHYPFLNGCGRLVDRFSFLREMSFPKDVAVVSTRDGFNMLVYPNELVGRHIALTGRFDPTIPGILESLMQPNDCVMDIGANVGYVSCRLLHAHPTCRVASIEPLQKVYDLLAINTASIGGSRSQCIKAAVSDKGGVGHMHMDARNLGASHLGAAESSALPEAHGAIEVEMIPGEEAFRRTGFETLNLVKIDVEGHESQVLHSLKPVIQQHRPRAIVFECHGAVSADHEIVRLFTNIGYQVHGITKSLNAWRFTSVPPSGRPGVHYNDYIARPA